MRSPDLTGPTIWRLAVFLYTVLLTSLHMAMTSPWRLATLSKLVSFEAAEPFQHRLLVPGMVVAVQAVLPLGEELLFALCEVAAWITLLAVAYRALGIFRIGETATVRRVLAFTIVIPVGFHLIVPDLVLRPLISLDGGVLEIGMWRAQPQFYYAYDLPAAVFTLALVLLMIKLARTRESRWLTAYLGLFALATVNRETTLFLIPAFAVALYGNLPRTALAWALVLQIVIFATIQGVLQGIFADHLNPNASMTGTQYEIHFLDNLALFLNPLYLLTFMARFSAGFYLPAVLLWHHLDPLLRRIVLWFGIPFLGSALLVGRLQEHRVVIEVVPLLWLCGLQAIATWRASRAPLVLAATTAHELRRAPPAPNSTPLQHSGEASGVRGEPGDRRTRR